LIELLTDPAAWLGLLTLIVLEVVLGIDNLIFIAILADKLPPHQRDRARVVGLSLAMFTRLGLLLVISWLIALNKPLFNLGSLAPSGRDLILFFGGLFLLYKGTTELHERLEGAASADQTSKACAAFWVVVTQIVVLDAVFSFDSVITTVGMVDELPIMMAAVVISMGIMLVASKPLTRFVNTHPTVVVLCLSFLLMIGLALVAEGLGFDLPKGYLYAAIGFSVVTEFFNQWASRNTRKLELRRPLRERTAESVLRLLGGRREVQAEIDPNAPPRPMEAPVFAVEERNMVSGVLTLGQRSIRSLMTPRSVISWIDLEQETANLRRQLLESQHSSLPVCRASLDVLVGVARRKDLIAELDRHGHIDPAANVRPALVVRESDGVVELIGKLREAAGQMALVVDEHGAVQGLVTPMDVFEAIAGEFPDDGEAAAIQPLDEGRWRIEGGADLHHVEQALQTSGLVSQDDRYISLAGFLLERLGHMPAVDETVLHNRFEFRVVSMTGHRIDAVTVTRHAGGASSMHR
jgi:CBS domain containing-hemolysin-like protein